MGVTQAIKNHFEAHPKDDNVTEIAPVGINRSVSDAGTEELGKHTVKADVSGVSRVEATQAVWGKNGRYLIILGLALMMIMYELDNTTVYNYQSYATSSFNQVSMLSTLSTVGTIVWAVCKPTIGKVSDVIGYIFYCIGQSGTNIMNDIIISDITTMKWRTFGLAFSFFPYLIIPWCSAYIASSVINGIGWRWGIAMFAILMPFAASFVIGTLLFFQRKAKKQGLVLTEKLSVYKFFSLIDAGGSFLLMAGFALMLVPMTVAATTTSRWNTPWVPALIVVGFVILLLLIPYEIYIAKNPIMPPRYFKNLTLVCCCLIGAFDQMGFGASHTYFYSWMVVAHNYSIRTATFLNYVNGVTQCLSAIIVGLIISKTRRYKWIITIGATIRLIGYGVMLRLRGAENSIAELAIVQLIQGIGAGFLTIVIITAAQIQVPHREMAQVTSLVLLTSFIGSSIGSTIAGGIYTNTFKEALKRYLGSSATEELVDTVFSSITGDIPAYGTKDRTAINFAVRV
ncbi:putative siderochrome-iron transporter [Phaeomoniella chlamydospora]|uniref:Putative siderochrome-iron transporter n=1 Tax=Phaeomoniella chlamydospora TaxID=158046 RepID=A0A0G2H7W3_PHACM|nr:putative siderochrome-iron transporter [Phaeomoniella chlamydospora]